MRTINPTLPQPQNFLQQFSMAMNDDMRRLEQLRVISPAKIPVEYEPVEYASDDGNYWECQHASTSDEVAEDIDYRREAETGVTQGAYYQRYRECNECGAQYSFELEEWL